ncbi:MAG: hypothetical protein QME47_01425 [Candidatus Thermoplasmatota archaeon]|nr:hypothetical protein [Candidatus Thermoplasmatota archaeon]
MKITNEGIGDFYEAIPTLIIVTTGLLVFMLTTVDVYSGYVSYNEKSKLEIEALEFMELVITYDGFLYEEPYKYNPGFFSSTKLEQLKGDKNFTGEKLKNELNIAFEFKIELIDVSGYYKKYNFEISTTENTECKIGSYKLESPVNIVVSNSEVHAAKLILSIWSQR